MGSERRVGAAALALLFALQIACQQFAAAQLQLPPVSRPSVQRLFGPLPQIGKGKPVPAGDPSFDSCAIPPWSNVLLLGSVNTTVYLGSGAFTGSQACGMCVAYRAPGEADVKYGVVGGWCPTCRSTDMGFRSDDDAFSIMGDMVWTPVQCDTGCGGLVYEMMDTPDDRMIAIKILQSRVPMYSVSVLQGDTYIPLQLNRQGFWTGEMELVSPTWQLQLVSVLGEQLTDVISILDGSNFMGRRYIYRRMQLPVNPEYASMEDDGGCLPATPAPTSPPPITTTPTATTTTPTVPETPGPTPGPTAPPSTLPPTPPPPFNPAELGSEFIPGYFEPNPNPPVITAPPANSSCGRCIEEELVQVCGRFGVPVYANLCFATVCEGVSPAAVSADNCRDTVPAPGSTPPSFDCSACLEFGFNPTCPPSGAPTYPNVCLAACAGVDVNTLSPEFCPPPPTPPPVTTTPAAIDCNSCFEFGMDNVTCAPGGFPFYWNTCFAECEGADLSSLSPANCDTAEPSTPAPASPTPQSFDCNSCGDFGFDPICPISGEPTYGNACLAFCSGADMSTLSPANCPGAVQPTTPPPTNNCSVCAVDGFDPVCPPSGEPIYGNPCFAACTGADLSALRPEFCPGVDPAPPPAPTMPPGVNCNSCASFGLNPVCPESGDVIYGNACLAACSGADSSMLRPEWCPPSAGVPRPTVVPTPTTTTPATTEPAPVNCDLCLAEGFDPVCPPSGDPLYGNLCIARCAGANLMELSSANCPTGVIPGNSPPPPPPLSTTTTASPPQTTTTPAPSSGASCAACSEQGFAPVCPSGGVPIYRNLCFATCIANVSPSEVTLENCGF